MGADRCGGEGEILEKSEKFKFSLFLFKSSKKYLIKIFQLSKLIFLEFYDFFLRLVGNCNTRTSINKIVDMSTAKKKKIYIRISLQEKNIFFR